MESEEEKLVTVDEIESRKGGRAADQDIVEESILDDNGSVESVDLELDRVRGKTFNRELSDLVSRIRSQEAQQEPDDDDEEDIPDINSITEREDDLLQKYHTLFYHAINLMGLGRINSRVSQFSLPLETVKDDLDRYINDKMWELSYAGYAVLYYNIIKKCFTVYVNHIEGIRDENIIIDAEEEFYGSIISSSHGVILNSRTVLNNIYYRKRFAISGMDKIKFSLYFVSLQSLIGDIFQGMDYSAGQRLPVRSLFPIIMIKIYEDENPAPDIIFKRLRDNLNIHFVFLARRLINRTQNMSTENHSDLYNAMDYNMQLFRRDDSGACFIVKCSNTLTKESLFVLKYLHTRLMKSIASRSVVSRIEKDRFLLLVDKHEEKTVKKIIDEFNQFYDDVFVLRRFVPGMDDPVDIYCAR